MTETATPPGKRSRIATAALVLGIVAIVIAFIPFGAFFGWIPGITAVVLGIVALARRTSRKAFAIIGLVAAVLGAPISGGVTAAAIGGAAVQAASNSSTEDQDVTAAPVASADVTSATPAAGDATPAAAAASRPAATTVQVPDVVGLAGNEARDKLEAAKFSVDWSQTVIIASNWKVTAQSAKKAAPGATIMLTVQPKAEEKPKTTTLHAVFRVWGSGNPDVTYSSDTDNVQGKIGKTYKMKVSDDALYYAVTAQLQGGGNIHCSVTINGVTRKGHAQGGYNICSAQLNSSPFATGGWD